VKKPQLMDDLFLIIIWAKKCQIKGGDKNGNL
jgi:hypothetical protein